MNITDFLTWDFVATFAGATVVTVAITQFTKGFVTKYIPTQLWSYIVSLLVITVGSFFTGTLTLSSGVLGIINALFITLAANGGYDTVTKMVSK